MLPAAQDPKAEGALGAYTKAAHPEVEQHRDWQVEGVLPAGSSAVSKSKPGMSLPLVMGDWAVHV